MPVLLGLDWGSAGAGAVITALATGVALILTRVFGYSLARDRQGAQARDTDEYRRARLEDRGYSQGLAAYKGVLEHLEVQNERREAVLREQQVAIELLQRANAECREEAAELRGALHFVFDLLRRFHATLAAAGHDPGPLPELPPIRVHHGADPDYLVRQAAQGAALVRAADKVIPPAAGGLS